MFGVLIFFSSPVLAIEEDNLYTFLDENKDFYNENLEQLKTEAFFRNFIRLLGDQRIVIHADDQIGGLIMSAGIIADVTPEEPQDATVDIFTTMATLRSIKNVEDFKEAWLEGKIKVGWRNPIVELVLEVVLFVANNPETTAAAGAAGIPIFSFFFYYTGGFEDYTRNMYPIFLLVTGRRPRPRVKEEKSDLLRIKYKWEGKGYMMKKGSHRLLVGNSYVLSYELEPLGELREATIKIRYGEDKLQVDGNTYSTQLPVSKKHHIEPQEGGIPELKSEATDFILIDAEFEDGTKEEGIPPIAGEGIDLSEVDWRQVGTADIEMVGGMIEEGAEREVPMRTLTLREVNRELGNEGSRLTGEAQKIYKGGGRKLGQYSPIWFRNTFDRERTR